MGYFSNGSEGDAYEEAYCSRCIHNDPDGPYCPVWTLHKRSVTLHFEASADVSRLEPGKCAEIL